MNRDTITATAVFGVLLVCSSRSETPIRISPNARSPTRARVRHPLGHRFIGAAKNFCERSYALPQRSIPRIVASHVWLKQSATAGPNYESLTLCRYKSRVFVDRSDERRISTGFCDLLRNEINLSLNSCIKKRFENFPDNLPNAHPTSMNKRSALSPALEPCDV